MASIENVRDNLGIKKKDLYKKGAINRKSYQKITENFKEITLGSLLELSNDFGINYIELLEICDFDVESVSTSELNNIDHYRLKCVDYIQNEDDIGIKNEITFIEENLLTFKNPKYLNIWIVLKIYLEQIKPLREYENLFLKDDDLESIINYYEKRANKESFVVTTQDLQVLSNLYAYHQFNYDVIKKLYPMIFKQPDRIAHSPAMYENFMHLVANALYLACAKENYTISDDILKYYKNISPKISENKIRFDLQVLIQLFQEIILFMKTANKEYYIAAMNYHETLLNFDKKEALHFCDDILESVLRNNKSLLKLHQSILLRRDKSKELYHDI